MNYLYTLSRSAILVGIAIGVLAILWWIVPTERQPLNIYILGEVAVIMPSFATKTIQFLSIATIMWIAQSFITSCHIKLITYLHFLTIALITVFWDSTRLPANQIIATLFFIKSMWHIIKLDFMQDNSKEIFSATILPILASIFEVKILLLIPLLLAITIIMDGIKAKTLLTMIFAMIVSVGTILGIAFLNNSIDIFISYYYKDFLIEISKYDINQIIHHIALFIVALFGGLTAIKAFQQQNNFSRKEKSAIICMILTLSYCTIYTLLFDFADSIFSLIITLIAGILIAIGLIDSKSKKNSIIFIIFIALLVISYFIPIVIGLL